MSLVGLAAAVGGCRLIDEELVDCPEEVTVTYRLHLITQKDQEMDDKLGTDKDLPLRQALEDYLADIFVEHANDADLNFYGLPVDSRALQARDNWNAAEKTYRLEFETGDYSNLAATNLSGNDVVSLTGSETAATAYFDQNAEDVVASHKTGLYTGRGQMRILERVEEQHFDVDLYMANDAGGIVLNVDSCDVRNIRCEIEGLADGFRLQDSTYTYDAHTLVNCDLVNAQPYIDRMAGQGGSERPAWIWDEKWDQWKKTPIIMCGVGFSSRAASDKLIEGQPIYWVLHLYVTIGDGTTTKSTIYAGERLPAAHLKLIKGWLLGDGSFTPDPPVPPGPGPGPEPGGDSIVVGVDVELAWNQGPVFEPVL